MEKKGAGTSKSKSETARDKWKMEMFRPKMDLMRAKRTLGINLALEAWEIEMAEVQKRFISKNSAVRIVPA